MTLGGAMAGAPDEPGLGHGIYRVTELTRAGVSQSEAVVAMMGCNFALVDEGGCPGQKCLMAMELIAAGLQQCLRSLD